MWNEESIKMRKDKQAKNIAGTAKITYCTIVSMILFIAAAKILLSVEVFDGFILMILLMFITFDYITTWIVYFITKFIARIMIKKHII